MLAELAVIVLRFVAAMVCLAGLVVCGPITFVAVRELAENPAEPGTWGASAACLALMTFYFAGACRCCLGGAESYLFFNPLDPRRR